MDIDEIIKVRNRKRMGTDVEKLREKVSQETEKIIKLQVAQDTAYWDLKEKLQQVENNHERLQQNMVEVQMQHETLSGQYQDELRLRPETLNKLASTREICDVLQDYSERLRNTLSRCKADQGALYDAYQKSVQVVRGMQNQQQQADERNKQLIENLQEKVATSKEHQGQLLQFLTSAKQQAEAELANARQRSDELTTAYAQLQRENDKQAGELANKDETIINLREEMKRANDEYNLQCSEARCFINKLENDIRSGKEEYSTLKVELNVQKEMVRVVNEERASLQGNVAALEKERAQLTASVETLKTQLHETTTAKATTEQSFEIIIVEKSRLEKEIFDYIQELTNTKQLVQELQSQLDTIEKEKAEIASKLFETREDSNQKALKIDELVAKDKLLAEKIDEIENSLKTYRETAETKINDMTTELKEKDKEIDSKADTINLLMSEVKTGTDARSRLEGAVQKLKKDLEVEKQNRGQLEQSVKDKEKELSKQMTTLLDTRKEKERLQEKIQEMQQKIDNIQRELTGKALAPTFQPAETDDNAGPPRSLATAKQTEFAVPRAAPAVDSALYHMFSDSSTDGDSLNYAEVERRFAALSRGERLQRTTLDTFRRRKTLQHTNTPTPTPQVKNDMMTRDRSFFKQKRADTTKKRTTKND